MDIAPPLDEPVPAAGGGSPLRLHHERNALKAASGPDAGAFTGRGLAINGNDKGVKDRLLRHCGRKRRKGCLL